MTGGSSRYVIQKYQELINNVINLGSTELGDYVLTGEDLLDLAEAVGNMNDYHAEYKEVKEVSQNLIKNIERLVKRKKGPFADELNLLLENAKEKLEEDE